MQIKCDYCGNFLSDQDDTCPNCGAVNNNRKRTATEQPKTIAELQQWYTDHNLPPFETTRFFIGQNYKGRRAFGIYEENGEFIVYKNKDDGSRAERYRGTDEEYAVNELYQKLKLEIVNQKGRSAAKTTGGGKKGSSGGAGNGLRGVNSYRPSNAVRKKALSCPIVLAILPFASFFALLLLYDLFQAPWVAIPVFAIPVIAYFVCKGIFDNGTNARRKLFRGLLWGLAGYLALSSFFVLKYVQTNVSEQYYVVDDNVYARYNGDYYYYNGSDYDPITNDALPQYFWNDMDSYVVGSGSSISSEYDFQNSDYYYDHYNSSSSSSSSDSSWSSWSDDDWSSSWDSDYSWDSGSSWDSDYSDWGSDW